MTWFQNRIDVIFIFWPRGRIIVVFASVCISILFHFFFALPHAVRNGFAAPSTWLRPTLSADNEYSQLRERKNNDMNENWPLGDSGGRRWWGNRENNCCRWKRRRRRWPTAHSWATSPTLGRRSSRAQFDPPARRRTHRSCSNCLLRWPC